MTRKWLCTIAVKDWVHVPEGTDRVIDYVEVETEYVHQDEMKVAIKLLNNKDWMNK